MFGRMRKKGLALVASALMAASMGVATPALADEATYAPGDAKLTKVIDAPEGTDASGDSYTFTFAGNGPVAEGDDGVYSGGVKQDGATLKIGDVVPEIPEVTLNGHALTSDSTLNNGQVAQTVVQKSIAEILDGVTFPHAGIYTYVVTESGTSLSADNSNAGFYVNASQAEYILRIRVSNTKTETSSELGNKNLTVESVTVERTKNDNGNDVTGKVNPAYPVAETSGKITSTDEGETPDTNKLAGDGRGRDVKGFTFANEYIVGGSFQVKKLYDGDFSDRTKFSHVKLVVYSEAAKSPDAQGCVLTYKIENGGIDKTNNKDEYGARQKLNGINTDISQNNDYMARFDVNGYAVVEADLKEDSIIRVTGEFGPYNESYATENEDGNYRMILSPSGLLDGQVYWVIEDAPGDYEPTGYVYVGEDGDTVDPRVNPGNMQKSTPKLAADGTDPSDGSTVPAGGLLLTDSATGSETTAFVVNTIDESKVSPTGILINNLPYILMVGGPLAIFAIMFVSKRRRNAAA